MSGTIPPGTDLRLVSARSGWTYQLPAWPQLNEMGSLWTSCKLCGGSCLSSSNTGWCARVQRQKQPQWNRKTWCWFPFIQTRRKAEVPGLWGSWETNGTCRIDYCSSQNVQCVLMLVHIEAKSTLIFGNSDHFTGPIACKEGCGDHCIMIWKA